MRRLSDIGIGDVISSENNKYTILQVFVSLKSVYKSAVRLFITDNDDRAFYYHEEYKNSKVLLCGDGSISYIGSNNLLRVNDEMEHEVQRDVLEKNYKVEDHCGNRKKISVV